MYTKNEIKRIIDEVISGKINDNKNKNSLLLEIQSNLYDRFCIKNERDYTRKIPKPLCRYSVDGKCINKKVATDKCKATYLEVDACLPYQRAAIITGESWCNNEDE